MIKSLTRTIPVISGNYTIACNLNDINKIDNINYNCSIFEASLIPLDDKMQLNRLVKCNLLNGKLSYDVRKYCANISYFYDDTVDNLYYNEFHIYDNLDNRDKNFEFGCKRISYVKNNYQYQFFAPIYIDDIKDLPKYFIIEVKYNSFIVKRIKIGINAYSKLGKLHYYLSRHMGSLSNDLIPVKFKYDEKLIVYKNVIDCKSGSIINYNYNIEKNKIYNKNIKAFDNFISEGYKNNNICISQIIPLSFLFNLSDFLNINEINDYQFKNFTISGYYEDNNGHKINLTDIVTNAYNYNISYDEYRNNIKYHQKQNIYNQEDLLSEFNYINTIKKTFNKWQIYESLNCKNPYILNLNICYENKYKTYYDYPKFKNNIGKYYTYLSTNVDDDKNSINTLILPNNNEYNYEYIIDDQFKNNYLKLVNNMYINWFDIYDESKIFNESYIKTNWTKHEKLSPNIIHKGIMYNVGDCDYFNIFINPVVYDHKDIIHGIYNKELNSSSINETDNYYQLVNNDQIEKDDEVYTINEEIDDEYIRYDEYIKSTNNENIKNNSLIKNIIITGYEIIKGINGKNCHIINYDNKKITYNYFICFYDSNGEIDKDIFFSFKNSKEKHQLYSYIQNTTFDIEEFTKNDITFFKKYKYINISNINIINTNIKNLINDMIKITIYNTYNFDKLLAYDNYASNEFKQNITELLNEINFNETNINLKNQLIQIINDINENVDILNIFKTTNINKYVNVLYDGTLYNYMSIKNNVENNLVYIDYVNLSKLPFNYQKPHDRKRKFCKLISLDHLKYLSKIYYNTNNPNIKTFIYYKKSYIYKNEVYDNCIMTSINSILDRFNITFDEFINHIKYEDNVFVFNLSNFSIKLNLYYRTYVYILRPDLYEKIKENNINVFLYSSKIDDTHIFYKVLENKNEIIGGILNDGILTPLFNTIYNDDIFKGTLLSIMNNNLVNSKIHNIYYVNNVVSFVKATKNTLLSLYPDCKLYKKVDINNISCDGIQNTSYNGLSLSYIVINTNILKSTLSFNIYGFDNLDNFEIHKINNYEFNTQNVHNLFKYLYPYLKIDILYNFINQYSNLVINPNVIYLENERTYIKRYFGNSLPLFKDNANIIDDEYELIYNSVSNNEKNEIQKTQLDIYHYSPIHYKNENNELISFNQYEYKHFNDNLIINLPNEFEIPINKIIIQNDNIFEDIEQKIIYFKNYLNKYYINLSLERNYIIFLLNKYNININKEQYNNCYKIISYKFEIK